MGHDEGWAGQGVGRRPQQVGVGCLDFAAKKIGDFASQHSWTRHFD